MLPSASRFAVTLASIHVSQKNGFFINLRGVAMRHALVFALLLLIGWPAAAQNAPLEGSTVSGTVALGRSTFALPPGEWKVAGTRSDNVVIDGIRQGAGVASVYLIQQDADGVMIAALFFQVPLSTSNVSGWNDNLCDRKDTLYRDAFAGRFDYPECLLINHFVKFWVDMPTDPFQRKVWDWLRANNVKLPNAVLLSFYRKYYSGDYVNASISVNPEWFGQSPATKTAWTESEWHPSMVKSDPKRVAFMESFKKWSYVMADSVKSTLMDRKPKTASLPSLDDLKVK
jgi:hypothetical protein